jgi:hypothetical protein
MILSELQGLEQITLRYTTRGITGIDKKHTIGSEVKY